MPTTNSADIAGLIEKAPAIARATFRTEVNTLGATDLYIGGEDKKAFLIESRPAPATQFNEGDTVVHDKITLDEVIAAPKPIIAAVDVSLQAARNKHLAMKVGQKIGVAVARGCDKLIANRVASLTGESVGSNGADLTLRTLNRAREAVRDNGYTGQIYCVLHPFQLAPIWDDLLKVGSDNTKDQILGAGYLRTLYGMHIYTNNELLITESNCIGGIYTDEAIGAHLDIQGEDSSQDTSPNKVAGNSLITIRHTFDDTNAVERYTGYGWLDVVLKNSAAGVKVISTAA